MLSLIVAVSTNGIIGNKGELPWKLSTDLQNFKQLTLNHKVLMGRKTFENVGLLSDRDIYVASHDLSYSPSGVTMVRDYWQFLNTYEQSSEEVFIAGGSQMYEQAIPQISKAYITMVLSNDIVGDATLNINDLYNSARWSFGNKQAYPASNTDQYPFYTFILENRKKINGILSGDGSGGNTKAF